MKLKIFLIIIFMPFMLVAKEWESPVSLYQDNYIIAGDNKDQVKFNLSFKFNLFYPARTGIFFGYSQVNHWKLYDKSSPFVETNYMPEVFYRFESGNNMFNNFVIPFIDYIQVAPIFHKSNGKDEENSRSMNTYYGQIQMSYGETFNTGFNVKAFGYYSKGKENKDISDYSKYYEADVFLKIKSKTVKYLDKEELHFKFSGNPFGKGWYVVEGRVRIISSYIQPKLFVQFRHGYDEFMIDYNKKNKALRAGVVF